MKTYNEIDIKYYDNDGNIQVRCSVPVTQDALVHYELMQSHYCKLSFKLSKPIYFLLGDFIDTPYGRFELIDLTKAKDNDTIGYSYEIQFDAYYRKFKNKILKYRPNTGSQEATFSLTSTISTHVEVIMKSLAYYAKLDKSYLYDSKFDREGTDYTYVIDASVDANAAKLITYSNSSMLDAIANIAQTFGCEWWFEGNILHFGTCENTNAITDFRLNDNIVSMSSSQSQSTYANRVYAFGAARNLPSGYKNDADADITKDGVVEKRLMLPNSAECSDKNKQLLAENGFELKNGYIQVSGLREDQYVEGVTTNDDIYPRNLIKTSKVTSYEKDVEDESTPEEGDFIKRTFYRVNSLSIINEDGEKTGDMAFRKSYILSGKNLHIVFQSGSLNGMDFECEFNPDGVEEILKDDDGNPILKDGKEQINPMSQVFEIVANEDYGRFLPDTTLHPKDGDTFVLYNWDSTKLGDTLVSSASNELLTDTIKDLKKSMIDPTTYTCTAEANYSYNQGRGNLHGVGDRVNLYNKGYGDSYRASRIIGYEFCLDIPYDGAKYYVGEKPSYSRLNAMESKIEELVYNGQSYLNGNGGGGKSIYIIKSYDKTAPTDYNVYSAKAIDEQRLNRTKDDTAHGTITFEKVQKFLQGLNIGDGNGAWSADGTLSLFKLLTNNFDSGPYGHGAQIDEKGNIEANSIYTRQFISAPKFVYNEISVTKAEQWNTNGYGTIESVDVENRTITLHLEENDYGSLQVGDICRGLYADIDNAHGADKIEEGALDDCNFVQHKGFFSTYFYVTHIITNEKGKFVFQYGKKSSVTPDPCAYMDFAQYGSFTDEKRQSSMYFSSRGNSYIEVLDGVCTWEVQPQNRVARYGWLGGLALVKKKDGSIVRPEGNGIYVQDNIYFGGNINYLQGLSGLDDLREEAKAYDVSLSQYQSVITVDDMGNVINGLYTEDEAKTTKQYRISTAVFVRKGMDILLEEDGNTEDVTAGHYRVHAVSEDCEVMVQNSTIFVTAIRNIKDGVAGTNDDANFDYDAMRKATDAMVTIVVELEGKTSKMVQMPIRIQHDTLPFMVCDLSNESASVAWNTKTAKYIGLPIKTKVSLLYHNEPWAISSLNISKVAGLKTSMSIEGKAKVITIDADNLTADTLAQVTKMNITVVGKYAGANYEYTRELTILKSSDTVVYELIPSADSIVVDKDGNTIVNSVSCDVYATSSDDKRYKLTALPSGMTLKYGKSENATTSVGIGTDVPVSASDKMVTFALFDSNNNMLDKESVPVLAYGKDGKGIEYIFKLQDTAPSNPTPDNYATNTEYQRTDKEFVPSGWTDDPTGVDAVNQYEWVSKRVSTNGRWGAFSEPAEYAHFGKHAPKAKSSDDIVTIPTDSDGNALLAFREEVGFSLLVDGHECNISSIQKYSSTLSNVSCSISSNVVTIKCEEGAKLGITSQTVVFKVTGTLDGSTYIDYVTVKVVPNVTGSDGDGYEYIYYLSSSSSASSISTPSRKNGSLTIGWQDDPMAPTVDKQYVYVAYKKGVVGSDGTFSTPKLFNRYPKSISKQETRFYTNSSLTPAPLATTIWNNGSTTMPTDFNDSNPWLWKIIRTTYTDGTTDDVVSCEGYKAKDGIGITSVNTWYGLSKSMTSQPSSFTYNTLSKVVIETHANDYVWSADKVTYTNNDEAFTGIYCIGKCSDLASVTEQYGTSASDKDKPTSWDDAYPTDASKGTYIWSRDKIVWKDGKTTYSDAQLIGYIATDGKHAPKASSTDDIVTIPTDSNGKALAAFSEDIHFSLRADGRDCNVSQVVRDRANTTNVSYSISGNTASISCAKGARLGMVAQTIVFKVTGTLDGSTYIDYVTVKVVPNVTGSDGDGYEYIYYLSSSSSASSISTPSRKNGSLTIGWQDDPMAPTVDKQYVYVAYKKGVVGSDGTFSTPKLFNRYPKSISKQETRFYTNSSLTPAPLATTIWNNGSTTMPTDFNDSNPWLWKIIRTTYTDGTTDDVVSCEGYKAKDGIGITSVNTWYGLSKSMTSQPSSFTYNTLSKVVIETHANDYVWSADKVTYTNNDEAFTGIYCIGKCSDLASVTEQYGTSASDKDKPTSWDDAYPTDASKGTYIWSRDKIVWKDGKTTYSDAQLIGYIATDGKHAPKASSTDDIVTIPTDSNGKALAAFSEDIHFSLRADGRDCNVSQVVRDRANTTNVSYSISGNTASISCAKGARLGMVAQTIVFKVTGTLDGFSYIDYVTVKVVPNVTGADGNGYEYIYYQSNYLNNDFSAPKRTNGKLTDGWQDDMMAPTKDKRYVFVAYKRGELGSDGEFSMPELFNRYPRSIISQETKFIAWHSLTDAPDANEIWYYGSTDMPKDFSDDKPWLWKVVRTNYTEGDPEYTVSCEGYKAKDGDGLIVGYQSSASEPSVLPTPKTLADYDKAQDDIGSGWTKTAPSTGGKSIVLGGKITTDEISDRYNSSTNAWGTEESEILLDGIKQKKTFYKTPSSLGNYGKCIRRIKVVNHFRDSYLRVMMKSYSETNWDLVCISRLYLPSEVINSDGNQIKEDSGYLNRSEYAYVVSGDGQSLVAELSMPDAGEYYFFIGYFKDGGTDSYGDYGLFAWQSMIALTESLWRTDGTVDAVGNITWSKAMPMQAEAIVMERAYIATANDTSVPAKPYRTNGILQGGWTAKRLAVSSTNRFIWESVRAGKHGTDSVQDDWSQPVVVANFAEAGKMGKNGCIVRNSEGWKSGATYHNDSALTKEQKYIDLIYIEDNNANDGWSIYQCNVTHTATGSSFDPSAVDSDKNKLWTKLSDAGPMYSPLIVAKNAVLKFAQGQQFNLMEGNNIFGSFRWVQNNADYAFWIGGTEGSTATTSITRGGKFKTTDADITGKITATSGQIGGFKLEDNNLVCSNARLVIGEERNTFTRMVVLDAKSFTYDSYNFALSVVNYGIVTQSSTTQAGIHINVGASNTSVQYPGIVMENGTFVGFRVPIVPLSYSMDLRNNASIYASGMCIRCNNSSSITITLPTSATGAKTGDVFRVIRAGTGDVTIKAPAGVSYRTSNGKTGEFTSTKKNEQIHLIFDGNTWFSECSAG